MKQKEREREEIQSSLTWRYSPDVKSLEDILVHLLAGRLKHALPADLKYLKCFSCYRQRVLTTNLDKQRATTEDMNIVDLS